MTKTNFQEMLNGITPEALKETQEVLHYINGGLSKTKVPTPDGPQDLTAGQRSVFTAALLIEYGKLAGNGKTESPANAPT